jgi:glycosyltransferase involved in cell wall biosynthesis
MVATVVGATRPVTVENHEPGALSAPEGRGAASGRGERFELERKLLWGLFRQRRPVTHGRERPIRVLLTTPQLESTSSPFREVMALARYLPRDEFELTVCALRKQGLAEAATELGAFGVPAFSARFRPTNFTPVGVARATLGQWRMARVGRFDIQHSLDWTSSPFEAVMARIAGRQYIYHQRNLNEGGYASGLRSKVAIAAHVIAISGAAREVALAHGARPERVTTVLLGLGAGDISPTGHRPVDGGLLSVGQITPRKRHEDAIRVLAALLPAFPSLRLRVAGPVYDERYHQFLRQLASALGVLSRVEFLGVRKDVLELMAGSQVLLHCADSEAFGWVILEAWSVGLPVVASRVGGPGEVITDGETGYLATMGDVSSLARAVQAVLVSPERASAVARRASAVLEERYSARAMVEGIARVYRLIARGGSSNSRQAPSVSSLPE